jgi:MazG family protein
VQTKNAEQLFGEYLDVVRRLRRECPWDREQTHQSIRHSLIEETYEVIEAIDQRNMAELQRELGDLLLHIALHAAIAEESGSFSMGEVLSGSLEKIIRRHPHVFGSTTVKSVGEIRQNWERIKLQEGRSSVVDGVPKELPSLLRASRVQEKASKVGFDWKRKQDVWDKVEEEIGELHQAEQRNDSASIEEEYGDLLFALVNYGRFLHINPELALRLAVEKFLTRFKAMETGLQNRGKQVHEATLDEMDELWNDEKRS